MSGWVYFGYMCVSAYIWYQYFRRIKWTFQWYGAKYLAAQFPFSLGIAIFEVYDKPLVEGGVVNTLEAALVWPLAGIFLIGVLLVLKFFEPVFAKMNAKYDAERLQKKKRPIIKPAPAPPPKKAPEVRPETAKEDKSVSHKYNPVKGKDESVTAVSSSVKLCATCVHWQGNREIKPPATNVVLVNGYAKGMCLVKRMETPQAGSCGEHSKLPALS